eukprot:1141134-Prymnesium_polylepis.1
MQRRQPGHMLMRTHAGVRSRTSPRHASVRRQMTRSNSTSLASRSPLSAALAPCTCLWETGTPAPRPEAGSRHCAAHTCMQIG